MILILNAQSEAKIVHSFRSIAHTKVLNVALIFLDGGQELLARCPWMLTVTEMEISL